MKKLLLALPLILIFWGCKKDNPVGPLSYGQGDDYAVYEKLLAEENSVNSFILYDSTLAIISIDTNQVNYFLDNISGLEKETVLDYAEKNKSKTKLNNIANVNYIWASCADSSVGQMAIITLSSVGYNSNKTQAVMSFSIYWGPLAAHGSLVFFIKNGDTWEKKEELMLWIS